jgi:hypothetical protein
MPIVYVHGVAVRNPPRSADTTGADALFNHLLQDISWPVIEGNLRRFVAPGLSPDPESVPILRAYWGDLGAHLGWEGASYLSKDDSGPAPPLHSFSSLIRSTLAANIRPPLNQVVALFMGDVFCYLSKRGDAAAPGPIPARVLQFLLEAQEIKDKTGEPLVVLSNSMGCEIMYDIVTYFLPKVESYNHIKVDYWCGVASQVGLFEELKLFMCSSDEYGIDKQNRVPFPDRSHLGAWWNVWDTNDVLSYSVNNIIEGVDDSRYVVGKSLFDEHLGYLQEERFYQNLADWISAKASMNTEDA